MGYSYTGPQWPKEATAHRINRRPGPETRKALGPRRSILDTIGNTPVVRINNLGPDGVNLFVKLEAANPAGSIKDRLALGVIEAAERDGTLKPGQTVIEATSGNTGIGLAMVCAQKGYPLVIVMAENFSIERRKLLRFLGAQVILTPASEKGSGMLSKAQELADKHGWLLCRQFENEANADIHSRTTAREILDDFAETGLDYWISGFGTGGTLKGVARVLKAQSPGTRIMVCEPDNSAMLASGVAQPVSDDGTPGASHPVFRPHPMQGWSPDFIPALARDARAAQLIDGYVPVTGNDALRCARDLAAREGILCGITGGAAFAAALEVARTAPAGGSILAMLPDTGERYLSTPLFADISEGMNARELEIAASTPGFRFGAAPSQSPAAPLAPPTSEAVAHVAGIVSDPDQPVVMFALEWCEFCWSVRKLFAAAGIEFRSVDLDSAAYRAGGLAGKVRAALAAKTGAATIPQIFVGGTHIGGATETFDAFNNGTLAAQLAKVGRSMDPSSVEDAHGFLPGWLHPR